MHNAPTGNTEYHHKSSEGTDAILSPPDRSSKNYLRVLFQMSVSLIESPR